MSKKSRLKRNNRKRRIRQFAKKVANRLLRRESATRHIPSWYDDRTEEILLDYLRDRK